MSEEKKDEKAAEEEFLKLIEDNTDTAGKKEGWKEFRHAFKRFYTFKMMQYRDQPRRVYASSDLTGISRFISDSENQSIQVKAKMLGQAFGGFMAFIDGIVVGRPDLVDSADQIDLSLVRVIKSEMMRLHGKKVRLESLRARILKIARKHAKTLDQNQKVVLAKIAAIFA